MLNVAGRSSLASPRALSALIFNFSTEEDLRRCSRDFIENMSSEERFQGSQGVPGQGGGKKEMAASVNGADDPKGDGDWRNRGKSCEMNADRQRGCGQARNWDEEFVLDEGP